ncbi:hypothetical protein LOAG_06093 [Loa loa]|uniref:Intraflagellar transport protein 46 homolog n=2 Tax=Loa loa TaxID=7209 RepID=A0A1S0TZ42_LOALO|nr:hypothetical protein LOAG_06093 [Loa loa]EFO22390.2 hypothetical protein LOAG_06093 [Loa loa]
MNRKVMLAEKESGSTSESEIDLLSDADEEVSHSIQNPQDQFIKENISALDDDNNLVSGISAIGAMIQGVTDLATVTTTIATGNDVNDITKSENEDKKFRANVSTILSADVKQLLSYVESYTPKMIHIEPILKPFLIDYIPAVGDVDAFIKIPRPDGVEDDLGLVLLDEPAMEQSDPIILNLKMRNELKDHTNMLAKDIPVKKLERADENIEEIEHWISSIKEIHRTKPSDIVIYTKPMPNIEHLMQEWPIEVENLLKNEQLPSAALDVSLEEYVDICLALIDIPVQKSRIQSLHVLFTLFAEFRNSQHFRNLAKNNFMKNNTDTFHECNNPDEPERLEL